jgi:hypothetical protein
MDDVWEQLKSIKRDLDKIDMELDMNNEAIESIEMELRFLQAEIDYQNRGN